MTAMILILCGTLGLATGMIFAELCFSLSSRTPQPTYTPKAIQEPDPVLAESARTPVGV